MTCWARAAPCDTMVATYDATKWPSVLIKATMNVVQQRMHLRHAIKSAWSTFGLDVNQNRCLSDKCWHARFSATSCDTTMEKYEAIQWPHVLISIEMNVVQQQMYLRLALNFHSNFQYKNSTTNRDNQPNFHDFHDNQIALIEFFILKITSRCHSDHWLTRTT